MQTLMFLLCFIWKQKQKQKKKKIIIKKSSFNGTINHPIRMTVCVFCIYNWLKFALSIALSAMTSSQTNDASFLKTNSFFWSNFIKLYQTLSNFQLIFLIYFLLIFLLYMYRKDLHLSPLPSHLHCVQFVEKTYATSLCGSRTLRMWYL